MIGRLQGTVASESADGTLVLDVHGVGYEVLVPLGTLGRCPRTPEGNITLTVVTHVREDAITLFGFAGDSDRAVFRMLTAIAGIGPRIAIAILGNLTPAELSSAVARGDVRRLQAVPGVGKRLAERLALELKDKLTPGVTGAAGSVDGTRSTTPASWTPTAPAVPQGPVGQLIATLINLGFKLPDAERAAGELRGRMGEPVDVLVRDALRMLVR